MDRFKAKALSECAPSTLVVSNQFELVGWESRSGGADKLWVYSIGDQRDKGQRSRGSAQGKQGEGGGEESAEALSK